MIDPETIQGRREGAGLTQVFMAEILDIDPHVYADRERNSTWHTHEVEKLDALFYVVEHGGITDPNTLQLFFLMMVEPIELLERFQEELSHHKGYEKYAKDCQDLIAYRQQKRL